jgi:hypothetical protein
MLSPIAVFAKSCAVLGSPLASQSRPGGSGVRPDGLFGAAGAALSSHTHTHHLQIFLSYLLLLFVCGPTLFFFSVRIFLRLHAPTSESGKLPDLMRLSVWLVHALPPAGRFLGLHCHSCGEQFRHRRGCARLMREESHSYYMRESPAESVV